MASLAVVPEPDDDGPDDEPDEMEIARKAATLHAFGHSLREIAAKMGMADRDTARRYVDLGKLAVSRRTAEDTRTDALLITLELLRACQGVLDRPGPMVDRAGSPVLDDEGYALPDQNTRLNASDKVQKLLEREAKLTGADAPSKSIQASVSGSPEEMRKFLAEAGVTPEMIEATRQQILEITSGGA